MNALSPRTVATTMMTPEEARKRVQQINSGINNLRVLIMDLHDREGWKALGYETWRECVQKEFSIGQSRVYQLFEAAKIEQRILAAENSTIVEKSDSTIGEKPEEDEEVPFPEPTPIPESHLRPLASVPKEDQPTVYQLAKESAPEGKLTAAHVEKTVREVGGSRKQRTTRKVDWPKYGPLFKAAVERICETPITSPKLGDAIAAAGELLAQFEDDNRE